MVWPKGVSPSVETREKIRQSKLGKRQSQETQEKKRKALMGRKRPREVVEMYSGERHGQWKGDNVGIDALHQWVRRHLPPPKFCQMCNKVPPYDLANVTGIYKRDFKNWAYYCRRCHQTSDGRLAKFGRYIRRRPTFCVQ